MKKKKSIANTIWTVILTIAALAWVYPIIMILMNSLKKESAISTGTAFKLPTADAFAGIANYVDAVASKGFLSSLGYSTFITITSVVAILVCCSMCAWYITRVNSPISKILYYLFVFSSRYLTSEYAMEYLGDLSRIWRRSCGIYVLRICKIDSCRNRRSCHDRRM